MTSHWAFIAAIVHAGIDLSNSGSNYSHERWLRVTQGFCALFEIAISTVTLCQKTQDQEGRVIAAAPQTQTVIAGQPGVPAGVGYATSGQEIAYQQPPQAIAYPQSVVGMSSNNPPPYPGSAYDMIYEQGK